MSYLDFFSARVMEIIVRALFMSHDRNRANFDPGIGNTPTSYGVSAWQSNMFYLEQAFGEVMNAVVNRSGSSFDVTLPTCRISFYKFGSSPKDRAADFRLDGRRSRKRQTIVESNQLSLFNYTMNRNAERVKVPEIVVAYSGNPEDALLEVHVGAPISSERTEDGWLWLEQVYMKDEPGSDALVIETPPSTPTTPSFTQMPQPVVEVEELPEERKDQPQAGDA
jgi:hypothetical protein